MSGWRSSAGSIAKTYRISFDSAIRAVDEIGQVAAELARRPDISILAAGTLTVTSPAGGTADTVTELDLVLASRIDEIMPAYGGRPAD